MKIKKIEPTSPQQQKTEDAQNQRGKDLDAEVKVKTGLKTGVKGGRPVFVCG
jgi:hypothetical protein